MGTSWGHRGMRTLWGCGDTGWGAAGGGSCRSGGPGGSWAPKAPQGHQEGGGALWGMGAAPLRSWGPSSALGGRGVVGDHGVSGGHCGVCEDLWSPGGLWGAVGGMLSGWGSLRHPGGPWGSLRRCGDPWGAAGPLGVTGAPRGSQGRHWLPAVLWGATASLGVPGVQWGAGGSDPGGPRGAALGHWVAWGPRGTVGPMVLPDP